MPCGASNKTARLRSSRRPRFCPLCRNSNDGKAKHAGNRCEPHTGEHTSPHNVRASTDADVGHPVPPSSGRRKTGHYGIFSEHWTLVSSMDKSVAPRTENDNIGRPPRVDGDHVWKCAAFWVPQLYISLCTTSRVFFRSKSRTLLYHV